jgi:hypothetical protein
VATRILGDAIERIADNLPVHQLRRRTMKRVCAFCSVVMLALLAGGSRVAFTEDAPHAHGKMFSTCAKACAECMNSCGSCYHHCATLVSDGNKDHTKTMTLCNDCAEVCATAAKLTSRHSPFAAAICETCAKTCDECGAACAQFPQDEHMADCAKACHDCAAACREMIRHAAG